jgi:hypothetical protein
MSTQLRTSFSFPTGCYICIFNCILWKFDKIIILVLGIGLDFIIDNRLLLDGTDQSLVA